MTRGSPVESVGLPLTPPNAAIGTPVEETGVTVLDMSLSLSSALDLVNPQLGAHHKLTCCVAMTIGSALDLSEDEYNNLFSAALVHDIGAASMKGRVRLAEFEETEPHEHAKMGANLLNTIDWLKGSAPIVRHHHVNWNNGRGDEFEGKEVSSLSHIIHLADRIAVQIDQNLPILSRANEIRDKISAEKGAAFHPRITETFIDLSQSPAFWLRLDGSVLEDMVASSSHLPNVQLNVNELMQLFNFLAFIIDSHSRYTCRHSYGVAAVAERLALNMGLGIATAQRLKIAGYLHDIGKLAIPDSILEKTGPLTDEEKLTIKGHSFYSEKILSQVKGMEKVAVWAAQHHEYLDGSGYPFGLSAEDLSIETRILTLADIFTALTEDRPYRQGLAFMDALEILEKMIHAGTLDNQVFSALAGDVKSINKYRSLSQLDAPSLAT